MTMPNILHTETLDEALYNTIHRNDKPLKAIAEEIGMSASYLTRSALPDNEDSETGSGCRFPLKKLISLIRATGNFSVIDFVEHALGRVAFKLPVCRGEKDIVRQAMKATKEFGELMGEVSKAMDDRIITKPEREDIQREARHTIEAVCALLQMVKKGGSNV